jgi:hypothetical protein
VSAHAQLTGIETRRFCVHYVVTERSASTLLFNGRVRKTERTYRWPLTLRSSSVTPKAKAFTTRCLKFAAQEQKICASQNNEIADT